MFFKCCYKYLLTKVLNLNKTFVHLSMENKTHWLQSPNKNYLGHWDLPESQDLILTIESAQWEEVINPIINKSESKRVVRFKEDVKPFICNQTNAQSIIKSTGVKYMEDSPGQKIALYIGTHFDRVYKEDIDCIRVRKEAPVIDAKQKLTTDHPRYDKAVKALSEGLTTINAIEDVFILDDDIIEKLKEDAANFS